MHDHNSFITLTYSDENLPSDYSIDIRTLQLFFKRLRKRVPRIRYFACGEYGGQKLRPHYHAIIFGYDFPDKIPWRKTPAGYVTYRSDLLDSCWQLGHAEIGNVTVESAGYVARYVTKKLSGDAAVAYDRMHPLTGEVWRVREEFALQSSKPGIGRLWYEKYSGDAFPDDFVVINGQKRSVPRYYKKLYAAEGEDQFFSAADRVSAERKVRAHKHAGNNTPERLAVREEIQERKAALLKRSLEDEL